MKTKKKSYPTYKKGDKVKLNEQEIELTIKGSRHNGYTWLYSFEEAEMECSQYSFKKIIK